MPLCSYFQLNSWAHSIHMNVCKSLKIYAIFIPKIYTSDKDKIVYTISPINVTALRIVSMYLNMIGF